MRGRSAQAYLTIVAIILGVLVVMQLKTQVRIAKSAAAQSATDQTSIIANLYTSNLNLREEIEKLRSEMSEYDESYGQSNLTAMVRELNKLRMVNGLVETTGPGIQLTASADLRPEDLQDLINELRNAGAEAIALNGQRVTVNSAVYQSGGTMYLDDNPVGPTYVLLAIGQPDTLERALLRKGGLITYLQTNYPDETIAVLKRTAMTLPMSRKAYEWQSAVPVR